MEMEMVFDFVRIRFTKVMVEDTVFFKGKIV